MILIINNMIHYNPLSIIIKYLSINDILSFLKINKYYYIKINKILKNQICKKYDEILIKKYFKSLNVIESIIFDKIINCYDIYHMNKYICDEIKINENILRNICKYYCKKKNGIDLKIKKHIFDIQNHKICDNKLLYFIKLHNINYSTISFKYNDNNKKYIYVNKQFFLHKNYINNNKNYNNKITLSLLILIIYCIYLYIINICV